MWCRCLVLPVAGAFLSPGLLLCWWSRGDGVVVIWGAHLLYLGDGGVGGGREGAMGGGWGLQVEGTEASGRLGAGTDGAGAGVQGATPGLWVPAAPLLSLTVLQQRHLSRRGKKNHP